LHAMQKKMVEFLGEKYGKKKNLNKIWSFLICPTETPWQLQHMFVE
jgi:hypothetical protein